MAKLLAYYNLCPTNVGTEFLGLSPDVEIGAVINTLGRNMVIIVKLSNQKQLRSWTVLDRLTAKVVYDFKTRNYVGVFMNQYLRKWDENCVDVNKIKKQKFHRNIHDVFSMEHLNTTVILYENGNTEALDLGLLHRKNKEENDFIIVEKGHTIKKVNFFDTDKGTMITYFVENTTDKSTELVYFMLERDTYRPQGNIHRIKVTRESGVDLSGFVVLNGAFYPALITVWSDKRIFMQQLTFDRQNASSIGQFIALLSNLNLKQPISIIGIGEDYFALYGANNGQDGALLMLYNLKFRIVQAEQFFKVYFANSNLWIIGNNLFLAVGQMLSVVPFRISKQQLSDIIGTQRNKDFSSHVDNEYINEEFELEESLVFDSGLQAKFDAQNGEGMNGHNMEITKKVDDLTKMDYFTSVEKVENKMNSILNFEILFDILRLDSNPNDTVITKLFTNPNGTLIMSEHFETLANEMEKLGFNEIEITKKLIPVLIAAEAEDDLGVSLKRYTNISEKELVTVLKYAIKKLIERKATVDFSTGNQTQFKLLNTVLSCTYNNESILPFLSNEFDLDVTIFLLNYLKEFLLSENAELEENPQNVLEFNADDLIIRWLSIIIDSQYQELLLSKDESIPRILQEILSAINQCITDTNDLKDFAPILESFIEKRNLSPSKQYSKWYSIENVRLY